MRIHQLLIVILIGIVSNLTMSQGIVAKVTVETTEEQTTEEQTTEEQTEDKHILSGIAVTTGIFASKLVDHTYSNIDTKIVQDSIADYSLSYGNLLHVPLFPSEYYHGISPNLALSGAFGWKGTNIVEHLQVGYGGSILFDSEYVLVAFTFGRLIQPVERLSSFYKPKGDYPMGNISLTKSVHKVDNFFALTINANLDTITNFFRNQKPKLIETDTSETDEEKLSTETDTDSKVETNNSDDKTE